MPIKARRPSPSREGFSLVEILLASTVFVGVAGTFTFAAGRGLSIFHDSGLQLEVRSRAQSTLDKAARTLLGVTSTGMVPALTQPIGAPPMSASDLQFVLASSWTPAGPLLSTPLRLVAEREAGETDDGTDENGNGLIDEYQLVLVTDDGLPSERRTVIGTGIAELAGGEVLNGIDDNGNGLVDEAGFNVTRDGDLLILRLTTERAEGSPTLLSHTEEIALAIRNR